MKLGQIIFSIFSVMGGIWSLMQIVSWFEKRQKQKMGISYSIHPVVSGTLYYQNYELFKYVTKKEVKIKTSRLSFDNQIVSEEQEPNKLYVEEIEFKNIGKKVISGTDFFDNDKLGLKNNTEILCISVLEKTPSYINTKIEITEERININFDKIKPNDSIFLSILKENNFFFKTKNDFLGQTNDINKFYPLDVYTCDKTFSLSNFWDRQILILKVLWRHFFDSILGFILLYFSVVLLFIYLTIRSLHNVK